MEIINEANEKFKDKQDEVCGFLFGLLKQINALEDEIFDRDDELSKKRPELGLPPNQVVPGQMELWAEYKQRLGEIVRPACTEKLLKKGYRGTFSRPVKYGYIDESTAKHSMKLGTANFIMKTANRAVVITHFVHGTPQTHKLVIKNAEGKWLVDEVYYGFENEPDKWHADRII